MPTEVVFAHDFADLRACPRPEFAHKENMATTSTTTDKPCPLATLKKRLEPFLVPYYLVYLALIGAITTGFIVLTLVIVLVATNFNVLGLIE